MNYYQKYLKYKEKYENLLQQTGGSNYQVKEGQFEISDPRIMDQLENVSILPMGYHTFYEGKDMYPELKQPEGVSVHTYPYFEAGLHRRSAGHTYTKISDAEMTGQPISVKKYKSDKDCADSCSNNRQCQSFNVSKKGKSKQCVFHSNSSRFVPDNIHKSKGSNYFEKTHHY
tara:strand:+ start:680 stop:1195 length:516 start_codon:yes stop_codon:yes gene_type:complete